MKRPSPRLLVAALSLTMLALFAGCAQQVADAPEESEPATDITPDPEDALVSGTDYHATGTLPCTIGPAAAEEQCQFGVIRESPGSGSGAVTITKPDGSTRTIFFLGGEAIGSDAPESDATEFGTAREDDWTIVTIGAERYRIVDAIIWGG